MPSLLFSKEILNAIHTELSSAKESVLIVSAYCKLEAIRDLDSFVKSSVRTKRLLLRFRLADIATGSTDFEVLEYCRKNGWQVYVRFDLHAKTYVVDNSRCIVGSANATTSGLGLKNDGNYEIASISPIEEADLSKIKALFDSSILINPEILSQMKAQHENLSANGKISERLSWDESIMKLFKREVKTLFTHELPESSVPNQNGVSIDFLETVFNGDKENLKESLRYSNCYQWLLTVLRKNDGCMYFGQLSAELHNALVSEPKPYRRDVKIMLSNLLSWCSELQMEELTIDAPNHSQRVLLI